MNNKHLLYLIAVIGIITSCNSNDKPIAQVTTAAVSKPLIAEPFKFHKMLEVSPGNYYDVFSWGRGTKDGGQYMILRSDSADQQYNAVNGDLEGPVQEVLNADMDTDGNPEIIIYAKSIDTNRYINVFVYEYQNDNARKLDFPRLTESQRKGYRGGDSFYIKQSKLIREFPVYSSKGKEATPSGQKRVLEYKLSSNTLYAKQISIDTATINNVPQQKKVLSQTVPPVLKKKTSAKKHSSSKTIKRHTTTAKKHHKRRG